MHWLTLLAGVVAVVAIATQSSFGATLSRAIGLWPTAFVVHLVGTLVALLPLWAFRADSQWQNLSAAPWYLYLSGAVGVLIVYTVSYTISHSSVTAGVSVILAAQLVFALLIDQFGWFGAPVQPVDLGKLAGVGLLGVGAWLVLR